MTALVPVVDSAALPLNPKGRPHMDTDLRRHDAVERRRGSISNAGRVAVPETQAVAAIKARAEQGARFAAPRSGR